MLRRLPRRASDATSLRRKCDSSSRCWATPRTRRRSATPPSCWRAVACRPRCSQNSFYRTPRVPRYSALCRRACFRCRSRPMPTIDCIPVIGIRSTVHAEEVLCPPPSQPSFFSTPNAVRSKCRNQCQLDVEMFVCMNRVRTRMRSIIRKKPVSSRIANTLDDSLRRSLT